MKLNLCYFSFEERDRESDCKEWNNKNSLQHFWNFQFYVIWLVPWRWILLWSGYFKTFARHYSKGSSFSAGSGWAAKRCSAATAKEKRERERERTTCQTVMSNLKLERKAILWSCGLNSCGLQCLLSTCCCCCWLLSHWLSLFFHPDNRASVHSGDVSPICWLLLDSERFSETNFANNLLSTSSTHRLEKNKHPAFLA